MMSSSKSKFMNARKFLSSRRALAITLLVGVDIIFFGALNPRTGSSFLIVIAGCLLLTLTIYALVAGFINTLALGVSLSAPTRKRLKVFLALFFVFLILMQSIGQLGVRDVIAALLLALLAYAYLSYNADSPKK